MITLIDYDQVQPRLMAQFIGLARRSAQVGYAVGSTSEQIVGALLNGRADWLPASCPTPLEAIDQLIQDSENWWHSMLAVHRRGWRSQEIYEGETL